MRVRLTTDRASLLGPAQRDGDVIEVPDDEGLRLLATRQAEPVEPETAMVGGGRNAMRPAGRNKQR